MEFIYEERKHAPIEIKYPKDFEKWIEKTMPTAVIYNRFKKIAHCVHCGETWEYTKDFDIRSGDLVTCPCCGTQQPARPHTSEAHSWKAFFWIWNDKRGINFAAACAWWHYDKRPIEELSLPATIALAMCGRISRTEASSYSYYPYWEKWEAGSMSVDGECDYPAHYPGNKAVLKRSFLKHFAKYVPDAGATDMLKFMTFFAKHPQAEYVEKAGFGELVESAVYHFPLNIYPNWRARTIPGILRLSPQDVDKLKDWGMFDVGNIALYHLIRKYKRNPKHDDMTLIANSCFDINDFHELLVPGTSPMKLVKYLLKQIELVKSQEENGDYSDYPMCHAGYYCQPASVDYRVKGEYRDYINLLDKLGYPKDDYYIYPKDLTAAHDAAAMEFNAEQEKERQRINKELAKKERKQDEKFEKEILPASERFAYKDSLFLIRPLKSRQDFIDEGRNNHNCVATYWENARDGRCRIFVLRRVEDPESSYVTIELSPDNQLKQCFATGNKLPDEDVKMWVDKWLRTVVWRTVKKAAIDAAEAGGQMLCQTA